MIIKILPVGQLGTNCYVVSDENTRECVIIDPGAESNKILNYVSANGLTVSAIFLTHAHFDHTMALTEVFEKTGAPVYVNENESRTGGAREQARLKTVSCLRNYTEGDEITVGSLKFEVLLTPGHTMGSVVLKCGNALFTGDTLFAGSCGRTDLGGDMDMMEESLRRLSKLEGDFEVYPGHAETTTLDQERKYNYYMLHANSRFPGQ